MLDIKNKRILSGIQPSGILHIGNYFGAIRQHIALQANNDCYYFVANYHAMTTIRDHKILEENSLMVAIDYLALGFDPDKAVLFMQSDVREVTELAWMLSTVTPMGCWNEPIRSKIKSPKALRRTMGCLPIPC